MRSTFVFGAIASALAVAAFAGEPVAHWKLDEKEGDSVADSVNKNNGKVTGTPGRTAGKVGGALSFNGKDTYVEIPNSKELENVQEGSYSVSAWFKPENAPPGTDDANDAQYAIVVKTGWHLGLHYGNEKKFMHTHFLKGDTDAVWAGVGTWDTEYEPGSWYHVVGVVDKDARVAKIYVDGELKGTSQEWDEKAVTKEYEQSTWKIGAAAPGAQKWAWNAKGSIDDVRIYASALTDDQVKALYDAGAAGKEK
ncbi:MAG TPA: LamG domain-containing protein [Planctomycetota bacterium]|nr:LamG domain-containing protein [Planctomycetota bacterium]